MSYYFEHNIQDKLRHIFETILELFLKRMRRRFPDITVSILSQRLRILRSIGSVNNYLFSKCSFIFSVRNNRAAAFLCSINRKQNPKTIMLLTFPDAYKTSILSLGLFLPPFCYFNLLRRLPVSPALFYRFMATTFLHFLVSPSIISLKEATSVS